MNKLFFVVTLFSFVLVTSCGNKPEGEKAATSEAGEAAAPTNDELQVNTAASTITWTGAKLTGQHTGTIKISDGSISVEDGEIKAGNFKIDMSSITDNDLAAGDGKEKLEGHLKSADFFNVEEHPTSTFEITNVKNLEGDAEATHLVYGNLTIKGITKEIGFKANVDSSPSGITVTTPQFTIDRTEWDVRYGSTKFFDDLKDKAINDEIGIKIDLKAA